MIRTGMAKFNLDNTDRWVAQDTVSGAVAAWNNKRDRDRFVRGHQSFSRETFDRNTFNETGVGASMYDDFAWDDRYRLIQHRVNNRVYYANYDPLTGRRTRDNDQKHLVKDATEFVVEVTPGRDGWIYVEEEKEETVTDYQQEHYRVLDALEAEAKKRNWCPEFDEFKKANNIVDDRKKEPEPEHPFPTGKGTVVDVETGYNTLRFIRNAFDWHCTSDTKSMHYSDDQFEAWLKGENWRLTVVLEAQA